MPQAQKTTVGALQVFIGFLVACATLMSMVVGLVAWCLTNFARQSYVEKENAAIRSQIADTDRQSQVRSTEVLRAAYDHSDQNKREMQAEMDGIKAIAIETRDNTRDTLKAIQERLSRSRRDIGG